MVLNSHRTLLVFIYCALQAASSACASELVELNFPLDGYFTSRHLAVGSTVSGQGQDCYDFTVTEYVSSRKKE